MSRAGWQVPVAPLLLESGELPKKIDKDPTWRSTATYIREEVEQLISDERIPEDRRIYYGLIFLTGMRPDEAVLRRFRDYDSSVAPLGKLLVSSAWDRRRKIEKAVKTEQPRQVPVHATLARLLAAWKLCGFARMTGRAPRPDDLIVPSRKGKVRNIVLMLRRLHEDLDRLGMRRRRQYDARRTFISLARGDGASKDILRWVTHGPTGDIVDDYTTLPWPALCGEVAKWRSCG
jgi:integrase